MKPRLVACITHQPRFRVSTMHVTKGKGLLLKFGGKDADLPPKKRARKSQGPHVRFWFFTDNGIAGTKGKDLVKRPEVWKELPEGVSYLSWQLEKGKKSEHPHLQGHIELISAQYLSWLHKHISNTAGFLVRIGTADQCDVYCHKLEGRLAGPYILGAHSKGSGSRTDLVNLVSRCKQGVTWKELIESDPNMVHKYDRFISKCKTLYRPNYDPEGEGAIVHLYYGIAGCGKTKEAFVQFLGLDFYELPLSGSSSLWWDGLDRHNNILMDDFCGAASHMRLDVLLKILDRYPRRVPVKHGFEWLPGDKHIIITSNIHPRKWYKWRDREEQWPALKRRIHKVIIWCKDEALIADASFWDFDEDEDFVNYREGEQYGNVKKNMYPRKYE